MKLKLHTTFIFLLSTFFCNAQNTQYDIQWQNTIGGSGYDELHCITPTPDGGYVLGGNSYSNISGDKTENSNGYIDYWVIKIDSLGNIIWQNTIGGGDQDKLHSITPSPDGGYVLAGVSKSNISGDKTENCNGNYDYWVVKIDSIGHVVWQNTIGGSDYDFLNTIAPAPDGGFILGGTSASNISGDKTENANGYDDYWVIKINSLGNIVWQNTIGGNDEDWLYSITPSADGGFVLGGGSNSNISGDKTENSNGGYDYWVVKIDSLGAIVWQNTIGGNYWNRLNCITPEPDGGYVLGGVSRSNISGDKTENSNGIDDYWVVKIDSLGAIVWQNNIGGNVIDQLYSNTPTPDGGYVLGGWSYSNISGDKTENSNGGPDYWVVKLSPSSHITGKLFADINQNNK